MIRCRLSGIWMQQSGRELLDNVKLENEKVSDKSNDEKLEEESPKEIHNDDDLPLQDQVEKLKKINSKLRKENAEKRVTSKKIEEALPNLKAEMEEIFNKRLINAEIKATAARNGLIDMDCLKIFSDDIKSTVKVTDDGDIVGINELFEKIKTTKPYFFKEPTFSGTTNVGFVPPQMSKDFKDAMKMSSEEFETLKAKAIENAENRKY